MPIPWASTGSLIYAAAGTLLGLYGLVNPYEGAALFGIDLRRYRSASSTSSSSISSADILAPQIFRLWGARNIALGLAVFAFHWQRMPKAAGITWLCCTTAGSTDIMVTCQYGTAGSAWVHAIGTGFMAMVGWAMLMAQRT